MNARPIALVAFAALLSGCSLLGWPARCQGKPVAYHVDFAHGDDARDGRTPATAWRHAPGDPNAVGNAKAKRLGPGDHIVFAAGVRYRGNVVLNGDGAPGAPIVFRSAPGGVRAIIDGSDPVASVRACRSADDCGGAAIWPSLSRVDLATPAPPAATLFTTKGPMTPAQHPNMPDSFYSDDTEQFLPVSGSDLAAGRAPLPAEILKRLESPGERRLLVWVRGNQVESRDILSLDAKGATFDPTDLTFYMDRPDRMAVVGHPGLVDRPGEYVFIEQRRAAVVYLPPDSGALSIGSGRGGIDLRGKSHIEVRGLDFENMTGVKGNVRTGIPVATFAATGENVLIAQNRFRNLWLANGQGALTVRAVKGLRIEDNLIDTVALGSGIRLLRTSDVSISGNTVRRIGRTGIMLMDVVGAEVFRNTVSDVKGVHGNGMSVYLNNQNVRVRDNVIYEATRPATFHGGGKAPLNDLTFACNVFVGVADSDAALTSWSSQKPIVKLAIDRNVLVGGKVGARLSAADSDVTVTGNVTNGIATRGSNPVNWNLDANRELGRSGARTAEGLKRLRPATCEPANPASTPGG